MSLDYVESIYGSMKEVQSRHVAHLFDYGDTVKIVPPADGKSAYIDGSDEALKKKGGIMV